MIFNDLMMKYSHAIFILNILSIFYGKIFKMNKFNQLMEYCSGNNHNDLNIRNALSIRNQSIRIYLTNLLLINLYYQGLELIYYFNFVFLFVFPHIYLGISLII